jgi:hypothetical protein
MIHLFILLFIMSEKRKTANFLPFFVDSVVSNFFAFYLIQLF